MRRLCFDTGSNYFHDKTRAYLNNPDDARVYFGKETLRFHAATVYDEENQTFRDFLDCPELLSFLLEADELVTFNGRVCDLIVLEKVMGVDAMTPLWRKTHHDLQGWCPGKSLEDSVKIKLPNLCTTFDSVQEARLRSQTAALTDEFLQGKLANTYRDCLFTWALFEQYREDGGFYNTFCDLV